MSSWLTGALIGGAAACGLWLVAAVMMQSRRPSLVDRVGPYLHDLPLSGRSATMRQVGNDPGSVARAVFGPSLTRLAGGVERVLGGSASIRRRLQRLGSNQTVEEFRIQQVLWERLHAPVSRPSSSSGRRSVAWRLLLASWPVVRPS